MYQDHIQALVVAWNTGNLSGLDAIIAPNFSRRAPEVLNSNAEGVAELKKVIQDFRTAFPNTKITVQESFFVDDRSFVRWTFEGTNTGPGKFPTTRKSVTIEGTSLARFENGKMVEELVYFDAFDFLAQLGIVSLPKVAAAS